MPIRNSNMSRPSWLRGAASGILSTCIALAALTSEASAMAISKIENGRPGTATYLLSGPVVEGDAARLGQAVDLLAAGTSVAVLLDSDGGDLIEGIRLGDYFHRSGIATFVAYDGRCHSACSMAFLGGRDPRTGEPMRVKPAGAKLGFHQFRRSTHDPLKVYTKADIEKEIAETQRVTGEVVKYLQRVGDNLSKLQFMLRAPAESMHLVSNEDCLASGISVLDEATGRLTLPTTRRQQVSALGSLSGSLSGLVNATRQIERR